MATSPKFASAAETAREPPAELLRPPDKVQSERLNVTYKTHPATLSNSSHNSTNSQNTDVITVISVKELEGTDISSNLEGGNTNNNQTTQPNEVVMNLSKETSRKDHDTVRNGSFPDPDARNNDQLSANVQTKRNQTAESSAAEAQSSNFSFGIRGHKSGQDIGESRTGSTTKEWTN
ncbi:hypothetical protein KY284_024776 [Solanum tuberosum]|nr:hypothetical protein KY284_024776 [Solanum tuberosum]